MGRIGQDRLSSGNYRVVDYRIPKFNEYYINPYNPQSGILRATLPEGRGVGSGGRGKPVIIVEEIPQPEVKEVHTFVAGPVAGPVAAEVTQTKENGDTTTITIYDRTLIEDDLFRVKLHL